MLLVRKIFIIILMIFTAAAIMTFAIISYSNLVGAETLTAEELKFEAEQLLFAGLLIAAGVTLVFIFLLFRSRNISNSLDKLINQNRINPASTEDGLLRLGSIGKDLNILYRQINEISEMRGLKLSAMSNTAEFLTDNIELPLLIIDVTGNIIQVSKGWLEQNNLRRGEIAGEDINKYFKGMNIKTVLSKLERRHLPVEFYNAGKNYRIVPLHDRNNNISYIAVIA